MAIDEAFSLARQAHDDARRADLLIWNAARLRTDLPVELANEIADAIHRTIEPEIRADLFDKLIEALPVDRRSSIFSEALSSLIGYVSISNNRSVMKFWQRFKYNNVYRPNPKASS